MAEQPTVEQPVVEAPQEVSAEDTQTALLAKLSEMGLENPESIEGMAMASKQAGNLANQLGDARTRAENAEAEVQRLRATPPVPQDMDYGETVDLGAMVSKTVRSELNTFATNMAKEQTRMQEAFNRERQAIMGDPDYNNVKDIYEKHMDNPNVQASLNAGTTTRTDEYNKLVRTVYRELLKESHGALNTIKGVATPAIPHMETSETLSQPLPSEVAEADKEIKNVVDKDKGFQGTDEDIQDLVKKMNAKLDKENPDFFKTW